MLQKRSVNPCATLLALYIMAVNEALDYGDTADTYDTTDYEQMVLVPYASIIRERCPHNRLLREIIPSAISFVRDADRFFGE